MARRMRDVSAAPRRSKYWSSSREGAGVAAKAAVGVREADRRRRREVVAEFMVRDLDLEQAARRFFSMLLFGFLVAWAMIIRFYLTEPPT
mmetsp:Transcript_30071/g.60161  ORF Transcript_30071/g.60161 Transcript_30071/m.60161 type:complete len:90 (-) Transcript_30071:3-272(-)